jgi:hypothetical protein
MRCATSGGEQYAFVRDFLLGIIELSRRNVRENQ